MANDWGGMTLKIRHVLDRKREADPDEQEEVYYFLKEQLRALARSRCRGMPSGASFSASVLIGDVFMKLRDHDGLKVDDRRDFLKLANTALRYLTIDHYRAAARRRAVQAEMSDAIDRAGPPDSAREHDEQISRLLELLPRLEAYDSDLHEAFVIAHLEQTMVIANGGDEMGLAYRPLDEPQVMRYVAKQLGVSLGTAFARLRAAREWLRRHLDNGDAA